MDQHVEITEDLADKLTPEKVEGENDTMDRLKILEGIAEVCMHQGQYHIATKKFTQAGNKMKVRSVFQFHTTMINVGTKSIDSYLDFYDDKYWLSDNVISLDCFALK